MNIFISELASKPLIEYLKTSNAQIIFTKTNTVYNEISTHPDIIMCQLGDFIFHGNVDSLGYNYPDNIRYNAACTGKFFIHNLKYTDKDLLDKVNELGFTKINVKQGYSKCSIAVIDENSIITSDVGIYNKCKDYLDVLLIEKGQIVLPGMNYGFIGGACGRIYDTIVFNGDLSQHSDYDKITSFINSKGLKCKWFDSYPLTDIGSILVEV